MFTKAPNFTALDQNNKEHLLSDYTGKWVLLYFYPKDNTPGCTQEACMIRDEWDKFKDLNCCVLGVSADSQKSHKKFEEKHDLPFPLLVDSERKIIKLFGVEKEKSMFGKTFLGINRESFLINPQGDIVKHYTKVKPAVHAQEVLEDIRSFQD